MSIWKTTSEDKKTWNKGENPKNMQRKTRIWKTERGRRGDGEESFIVKKGVYIIMFYRLDCPWLPHAKFPAGWVGELLLLVKSKVKGKTREESRAAPVLPAIQARGEILQLNFQLKGFNIFIGKQFNIIHDKTRMGIGQAGPTWSYLEVQILISLSLLESLQGRRRVVSIKYYKKKRGNRQNDAGTWSAVVKGWWRGALWLGGQHCRPHYGAYQKASLHQVKL